MLAIPREIIIPRDPVALINEANPEGSCPVCQLDFRQNETGVVYHAKKEPIHAAHLVHRLCLKLWCEGQNPQTLSESNCLLCNVPMNVRPIFELTRLERLLRNSPQILARSLFWAYLNTSMHAGLSLAFRRFDPHNLSANPMIALGQGLARLLIGSTAGPLLFVPIVKCGLKIPVFRKYLESLIQLAVATIPNVDRGDVSDDIDTSYLTIGVMIGLTLSIINYCSSNTSPTRAMAIAKTGIISALCIGVTGVLQSVVPARYLINLS